MTPNNLHHHRCWQPRRNLHRDDGHVPGVGVTLNYTDTREGCLLVDLSIDIGTNPRWREGHDLIGA